MLLSVLTQDVLSGAGGLVTCLVGGVILVALILLASAIKIIPEYQRMVVFRLGRCVGARGPGIVFLIPIVDRGVKADLREQVREIPHVVHAVDLFRHVPRHLLAFLVLLTPTLVLDLLLDLLGHPGQRL